MSGCYNCLAVIPLAGEVLFFAWSNMPPIRSFLRTRIQLSSQRLTRKKVEGNLISVSIRYQDNICLGSINRFGQYNIVRRIFECYQVGGFVQQELFKNPGNIGKAFIFPVDNMPIPHNRQSLYVKNT